MSFHECILSFELSECHVKEDVFQSKIMTVCFIFKMAYFLYLQIEMTAETFSVS